MKIQFKDNVRSALAVEASPSATVLTVKTGEGAKFSGIPIGSKMIVTLGNTDFSTTEIVEVISVTGDTLTLSGRGINGQTALTWPIDTILVAPVTAAMATFWQYNAPENYPYGVDAGNNTVRIDGQVSYGKYNITTAEAWQSNTTYPEFAVVSNSSGFDIFVSAAGGVGTSSLDEPIWPSLGGTVTDGTVLWMNIGGNSGITGESQGSTVLGILNYSWSGGNVLLGNNNIAANEGNAIGYSNKVFNKGIAVGQIILLGKK